VESNTSEPSDDPTARVLSNSHGMAKSPSRAAAKTFELADKVVYLTLTSAITGLPPSIMGLSLAASNLSLAPEFS
jgi:hypothetical protein